MWTVEASITRSKAWETKVCVLITTINCVSEKMKELSGLGDIGCEKNLRTDKVDRKVTEDDLQRAASQVKKGGSFF